RYCQRRLTSDHSSSHPKEAAHAASFFFTILLSNRLSCDYQGGMGEYPCAITWLGGAVNHVVDEFFRSVRVRRQNNEKEGQDNWSANGSRRRPARRRHGSFG